MAMSYCTICEELKTTRYIALYVAGSEGTNLCHKCEMLVVGFIRDEKLETLENTIRDHLRAKETDNG